MKNIFRAFGSQNTTNEQPAAMELNEQDLEQVTGASGGDYCYNNDDDDHKYDDDDDCNGHRHHHHRRHDC